MVQFIVSPNVSFSKASWIEPAFVKHSPEFNWKYYPVDNKFVSQTHDITIFIFNTTVVISLLEFLVGSLTIDTIDTFGILPLTKS